MQQAGLTFWTLFRQHDRNTEDMQFGVAGALCFGVLGAHPREVAKRASKGGRALPPRVRRMLRASAGGAGVFGRKEATYRPAPGGLSTYRRSPEKRR